MRHFDTDDCDVPHDVGHRHKWSLRNKLIQPLTMQGTGNVWPIILIFLGLSWEISALSGGIIPQVLPVRVYKRCL